MKTQCEQILNHLRGHAEGLTTMDAIDLFGCTRLASRIHDLKKLGYDITKLTCQKVRGDGRMVRFARYYMIGDMA